MQEVTAKGRKWDNRTRWAACLCLVSLLLCFVQGWQRSASGIDLVQYVLPAKLWLEGINPYDLSHYSEHYHRLQPNANYWYYAYPSPPHALIMMLPLALFTFETGFKIWWIISFASLLVSFWCLTELWGKSWSAGEKFLFVALMAQSRLIQSVAYRGQLSLFELALILAALICVRNNRQTAAGILMGLACLKYTLALPLILYLLWFRLWKPLAWAGSVVAVGGLIAAVPLGVGTTLRTLLESLAYFSKCVASELERNYHLLQWQTIYASAFGRTSAITSALNLGTLVLVLSGFILLWRRRRGEDRDSAVFAALVMFSLTVVYHRVYDGVFVFIVAAIFWKRLTNRNVFRSPALLTLGATLALFLFVISAQSLVEKVSNKLSAIPAAMGINAWLCLLLLIEVLWLAWTNKGTIDDDSLLSSDGSTYKGEAVIPANSR